MCLVPQQHQHLGRGLDLTGAEVWKLGSGGRGEDQFVETGEEEWAMGWPPDETPDTPLPRFLLLLLNLEYEEGLVCR